jgi:putative ABC transport system substrate-binding protein
MRVLRSIVTAVVALAVLAVPMASEGQMHTTRVGLLGPAEEPRFSEIGRGLRQGLREQGHGDQAIEILERRVRRGDSAGAEAAVRELAAQRALVILAVGSTLAEIARRAASAMPVVFVTPGDPVAAGLLASLARPGRNMTAVTFEYPELSGKRLELLTEVLPRARRVLVLYDPRDVSPRQSLAAAREAAAKLRITLVEREVRTDVDVARAMTELDEVDGLLAVPGGVTSSHYAAMIRAANVKQRPTVFPAGSDSTRDALMTYGAGDADSAREAARLVDKVLRGANAGDLPVERPTRITLVVNLKTSKALGLAIPPSVLARADEVIR